MEFAGEFETHLTVRLHDSPGIEALQHWATAHGLKCVHIVLDRGLSASQPMLTRHGAGTLAQEHAIAAALRELLEDAGFAVTRLKTEVPPWNQDVPESEEEARRHPPERYFEHHIKLLLGHETDTASLRQLAESYDAHLSRNALRIREGGLAERFVTQRCIGVGRGEAHRRLEALLDALRTAEYSIIEFEEEFVVYDSNLSLDDGWITPNNALTGSVPTF